PRRARRSRSPSTGSGRRCWSTRRWAFATVQRDRIPALLGQPERVKEPRLQHVGALAQPRRRPGFAERVSHFGSGQQGRVLVTLHLADRDRRIGGVTGGVVDAVEAVFPALVDQPTV